MGWATSLLCSDIARPDIKVSFNPDWYLSPLLTSALGWQTHLYTFKTDPDCNMIKLATNDRRKTSYLVKRVGFLATRSNI